MRTVFTNCTQILIFKIRPFTKYIRTRSFRGIIERIEVWKSFMVCSEIPCSVCPSSAVASRSVVCTFAHILTRSCSWYWTMHIDTWRWVLRIKGITKFWNIWNPIIYTWIIIWYAAEWSVHFSFWAAGIIWCGHSWSDKSVCETWWGVNYNSFVSLYVCNFIAQRCAGIGWITKIKPPKIRRYIIRLNRKSFI